MIFQEIVTDRVLAELQAFNGADMRQHSVWAAINTTTMLALVDIQSDYPSFDAKAMFKFEPTASVVVTWWEGDTTTAEKNKFTILFNPVRIDDAEDAYSAYDRAMSIL